MFAEPFADGHTWVHRLDPRLRVAAASVLSCLLAVTASPGRAAAGLAFTLVLLLASRPPLKPLVRRLAAVNAFVLFLWLFAPFSIPGPALFTVAGFGYSATGAARMALITLKANAIGALCLACVATMPVAAFGQALAALRAPRRFVFLLLFTYRAIFLLSDEWQRLDRALKLRGFAPGTNRLTYRTYGNLVGLTLLRSLDRADRIRQAMLLRGFDGRFHTLSRFRFTARDTAFLAACLLLTLLVLRLP